MRPLFLLRLGLGSDGFESEDDEDVEDDDERDGDGEAEDERVPDEGLVGRDGLPLGPADRARRAARTLHRRRVQDNGQHHHERQAPSADADHEGDHGIAVAHGTHRVTNGQIAISAHDCQREDTREPVDWREYEEEFAHVEAEHPRLCDCCNYEERKAHLHKKTEENRTHRDH